MRLSLIFLTNGPLSLQLIHSHVTPSTAVALFLALSAWLDHNREPAAVSGGR